MIMEQQAAVRVPQADWDEFLKLHDRKASEAIRQFIAWSLRRPGADLPAGLPEEAAAQVVPDEVIEQFAAWYLRQPGAQIPARPGGETKVRPIRVGAEDWGEFLELHGRNKASEAIRQFIAWSLRRPGAREPSRPPAP
jgi:hypothetical protein